MSAQEPELDIPEVDEIDTPYKRKLALAVALLALFGGVVGFAAGSAGAQEERTGTDAQRASVVAMSGYSDSAAELYEMLDNSLGVSSLRHRGAIASTQAGLLGAAGQQQLAQRWDAAARQVSDSSILSGHGTYANNPVGLYAGLLAGPDRASLQQQAAAETSADWASKRRLEIGIVTLVAVALTLLGLSLTVEEGVRRYLVWPAGVVVAVCVIGFGWVLSRPVAATPRAAIGAVADGDRLYSLRDYQGAVKAYSRALSIRPDYPNALSGRASATILANSPQRNSVQFVITTSTTAAYRSAIADLSQALRDGGDNYLTVLNLGAAYFHVRDYAACVLYSQQAIALNPGPPLPWMNLAIGLLAEGRTAGALRTYRHVIHLITARPDPAERQELFSSGLTGLEILAGQQPQERALVGRVEGELVAAESSQLVPRAATAARATVSAARLQVAGPQVSLTYRYTDIPTGARLTAIGYIRPRGTADWIQPRALTYFYTETLKPAGTAFVRLIDRSCPAPGEYRIDLYSGTRRLASATARSTLPREPLIFYDDPVSGVVLCRPRGWPFSPGGPIALTSPDRQRHMAIEVAPLTPADLKTSASSVVRAVLGRMTRQLSPHARVLAKKTQYWGGIAGTARTLRLPGGRTGIVWASVGTDGILRTLAATYPANGGPGALNDVALYLQFLS
ncbi:MAG: tetratricopeptide repeat protein [Streptosporangiales bacterium]